MARKETLERIKNLRESKGLSQREIADELGIGRTTYLNFEKGKTKLYSKNLTSLARYFDVSEEYLLFGEAINSDLLHDVEDFENKRLALINEYEDRLNTLNEKLSEANKTIEENKQIIQSLTKTNQFLLSRLNKND